MFEIEMKLGSWCDSNAAPATVSFQWHRKNHCVMIYISSTYRINQENVGRCNASIKQVRRPALSRKETTFRREE